MEVDVEQRTLTKELRMNRWILNFLRDERGAETVELTVTGVCIAGGAVAGLNELNDKVSESVKFTVRKVNLAHGE